MAHPKSRISKQRKHKRRTHKKAATPQVATCSTTAKSISITAHTMMLKATCTTVVRY
ncbi:50S ribosomal protein L32 [Okeania hirsuta]|uniref:50S ribosomal protein L32 n=1 Tax=Okeania hirsuta TaxID=1458930 RepID=UPI0019610D3F